jgi:hypothetical protein
MAGALALATLLAGCAEQARRLRGVPVYSVDQRGAAKSCTAPEDKVLEPGSKTTLALTLGNDGGWCGLLISQPGDKPFSAGLITTLPAHGRVYVHTVGDSTRIDYTPERGYTGPDSYVLRLVPGDSTLTVNVTVTPPSGTPAP